MIEDNPDQEIESKRKTYAPLAFGSKIFSLHNLKCPNTQKKNLAINMAILEFAHLLWEATKPTIVLTDNKFVSRFFQTKAIPPALWNSCDFVLQFNFKIAHIAGSVNTAADFLSRLELKVTEKILLKIREDIQTTPIEVTTLPLTSLTKNNFSSHTQLTVTSQKNRPFNEKNNRNKTRSNGQRMKTHPS